MCSFPLRSSLSPIRRLGAGCAVGISDGGFRLGARSTPRSRQPVAGGQNGRDAPTHTRIRVGASALTCHGDSSRRLTGAPGGCRSARVLEGHSGQTAKAAIEPARQLPNRCSSVSRDAARVSVFLQSSPYPRPGLYSGWLMRPAHLRRGARPCPSSEFAHRLLGQWRAEGIGGGVYGQMLIRRLLLRQFVPGRWPGRERQQ